MCEEKEEKKENKMGVVNVHKLLVSMAAPMVLSMLVQALYNVVDSIFVAQLPRGEEALTAVSLAFPAQNLMIGLAVGTSVGVNAYLARNLGAKNYSVVNRSAGNGILLSVICFAVFAMLGAAFSEAFFAVQTDVALIVSYGKDYLSICTIFSLGIFVGIMCERLLTATGRTTLAMVSQMAGAITNIILDPIMIFGWFGCPELGVAGAAWATVIGQWVNCALGLTFNLLLNKEIRIRIRDLRPNFDIIRNIYRVGFATIAMNSTGSFMVYAFNQILIGFTEIAAAVFGVYFKLQSFVFMPVFGLNNAMTPIIAYNYGARRKDRIIATLRLAVCYASGIMLLGLAVFQIFPEALLGFFNASRDVMVIGVPALRIVSLHFIIAGFSVISISTFQALNDGGKSLIVSLLRQLGLLLPVAWLLSLTRVLESVWWSIPIAELGCAALTVFFLIKIYRQKIKPLGGETTTPETGAFEMCSETCPEAGTFDTGAFEKRVCNDTGG
ncbi:MAG: MATE family efflux transporter [Clostridiales bacterium]|nr:MATE family efflux transporter [Clostridiales bacterium]